MQEEVGHHGEPHAMQRGSSGPGPGPGAATHKDPVNSVVFSLKNQVGGLARALQVFQVNCADGR